MIPRLVRPIEPRFYGDRGRGADSRFNETNPIVPNNRASNARSVSLSARIKVGVISDSFNNLGGAADRSEMPKKTPLMSGELGRAGSLLAIGLGATTEKQRHSQQSNLWLLRTLRRDWCMTEINSERSRPRLPLLESGQMASSCLEQNGGVIVVRGVLPQQQHVRHFAAAVFAPVPKLALR
jgi:hypothetical protein